MLSGFRDEVENVSANQRPGQPSFSDRLVKHKLGRGHWYLASCQVSLHSVQRFQRSRKSKKLMTTDDGRMTEDGQRVITIVLCLRLRCTNNRIKSISQRTTATNSRKPSGLTPSRLTASLRPHLCVNARRVYLKIAHERPNKWAYRLSSVPLKKIVKIAIYFLWKENKVVFVTPTDRPQSSWCYQSFWWRFCVVTVLFGFVCGCRSFCHGTESDLFVFLSWDQPIYIHWCFIIYDTITKCNSFSSRSWTDILHLCLKLWLNKWNLCWEINNRKMF